MANLPGTNASYLDWGLLADRPANPGTVPNGLAHYYATDESVLAEWVDGAWVELVASRTRPVPPPPPPGPPLNQWACNVAGWLTYDVCRLLTKKAVDLLPITWIGDVVTGIVSGVLDVLLPASIIADGLIDTIVTTWLSSHISGLLTAFGTAVLDDALWAKIHCRLYNAIVASPTNLQTAMLAAGTAIAAIGGYASGVFDGINYLLQHFGIISPGDIPLAAIAANYDCSTCATTGIGPTKPLLQTSFDLTVTDGTTTETFTDRLTFAHAVVSGTAPAAVVTPNTTTASALGINQPDNQTLHVDGSGVYSVLNGQLAMISLDQLGLVAATSTAGATISGLVAGNVYAVQSTGGPWHYLGDTTDVAYDWAMSVDGGATWQVVYTDNAMGAGRSVATPVWAASAAYTDSHHARVVFVAATTSVRFRVADSVFGDNTGTLGWQLLDVTYEGSSVQVQHNGAKVGIRPIIDFEDTPSVTVSVADDPTDDRVSVSFASSATGSVTSVALTAPSEFAVGGSPITASGTLAITWNTPVSAEHGGTGIDSSAVGEGGILVGTAGHAWQLGSIAAGTGVTVSEASGVFTIAASGTGGGGTALTLSSHARQSAATAASITVSLGANSWSHLLIVLDARGDLAANNDVAVYLRFNSDSAAHYDSQYLYHLGASAGVAVGPSQDHIALGNIPAASALASRSGVHWIRIPNLNGSDFHKSVVWQNTESPTDSNTTFVDVVGGGNWRSTAAVTAITLFPSSGNFVTGTSIWVYAYA